MFSGIIETTASILQAKTDGANVQISVKKPSDFNDISIGDSIAHDGVCLTVESFDDQQVTYILAAETLHITGWKAETLKGRNLNVERSLKLNDRIHGHLVTGHVDGLLRLAERKELEGSLILKFQVPEDFLPMVWRKGSICINGVSLTINDVEGECFEVCLIPETLRRTNLGAIQVGDSVNFEADQLARGILRLIDTGHLNQPTWMIAGLNEEKK